MGKSNFGFTVLLVAAGAHAFGVVQILGVDTLRGEPMVLCDSFKKRSQVILVLGSLDLYIANFFYLSINLQLFDDFFIASFNNGEYWTFYPKIIVLVKNF